MSLKNTLVENNHWKRQKVPTHCSVFVDVSLKRNSRQFYFFAKNPPIPENLCSTIKISEGKYSWTS